MILCKDAEGKIGMRVKSVNKGVFVCLVKKNSPAALAGELLLATSEEVMSPKYGPIIRGELILLYLDRSQIR